MTRQKWNSVSEFFFNLRSVLWRATPSVVKINILSGITVRRKYTNRERRKQTCLSRAEDAGEQGSSWTRPSCNHFNWEEVDSDFGFHPSPSSVCRAVNQAKGQTPARRAWEGTCHWDPPPTLAGWKHLVSLSNPQKALPPHYAEDLRRKPEWFPKLLLNL